MSPAKAADFCMEMKHAVVSVTQEFWLENLGCGDAFVITKVEISLGRINIKLLKHLQKVFSLWCSIICISVPNEFNAPRAHENSLKLGNSCKCSLSPRANLVLNTDLTADKSLKLWSPLLGLSEYNFSKSVYSFFFNIWRLLTLLSRNPKLPFVCLKHLKETKVLGCFSMISSHFHLVFAVKDLPAVM